MKELWKTLNLSSNYQVSNLGGIRHIRNGSLATTCLTTGIETEYASMKIEGFTDSCISRCCKGERASHKGYKWRYNNDKQCRTSVSKTDRVD